MTDKNVLDLGCGFGEHCKLFAEKGAEKVIGIDLSQKMLQIAQNENSHPKISYVNLPMEEVATLNQKFDIVVSSLAFHYVKDYENLIQDIYNLMVDKGTLIFSQEHPFVTSHLSGERWTRDVQGMKIHANISNYAKEGIRDTVWFVDNVKKYHRTFSTIINTLITVGFQIDKIIEPLPNEETLEAYLQYTDLYHRPDFLLIKVKK